MIGGGAIKNNWDLSDVIYGWPLTESFESCLWKLELTLSTSVNCISFWGRFHQHTVAAFLRKENEKLYLVSKLGKLQTTFGKKCANLGLKFEVLIIVEIEQQFFCAPGTFRLAKLFWWNRPLQSSRMFQPKSDFDKLFILNAETWSKIHKTL